MLDFVFYWVMIGSLIGALIGVGIGFYIAQKWDIGSKCGPYHMRRLTSHDIAKIEDCRLFGDKYNTSSPMAHVVVRIRGKYCEWSLTTDAPASKFMSEKEIEEKMFNDLHPMHSKEDKEVLRKLIQEMIRLAKEQGTSQISRFQTQDGESFVARNRAGNGGKCLTLDELLEQYSSSPE